MISRFEWGDGIYEGTGKRQSKKSTEPFGEKGAEPPAKPGGWHSTDELEIARRRWRAEVERIEIKVLSGKDRYYGDYSIRSGQDSPSPYRVEIRSLSALDNSCTCPDYRKNGLGTCKHIEAVLRRLRAYGEHAFGAAARQGSPYVDIYLLGRGDPRIRVSWPAAPPRQATAVVGPFFSGDGDLLADPEDALPALRRALEKAPPAVQEAVRVSEDVDEWAADLARRRSRSKTREKFLEDVRAGKRSLDVLKVKLYPYQEEGMLHLAFGERALLADEMGLGKTIQAIAACELLRQLRRIERVLVVSPASLKAEWEEQIGRFTDLPVCMIVGTRAERLRRYRRPAFFYLCKSYTPGGRNESGARQASRSVPERFSMTA